MPTEDPPTPAPPAPAPTSGLPPGAAGAAVLPAGRLGDSAFMCGAPTVLHLQYSLGPTGPEYEATMGGESVLRSNKTAPDATTVCGGAEELFTIQRLTRLPKTYQCTKHAGEGSADGTWTLRIAANWWFFRTRLWIELDGITARGRKLQLRGTGAAAVVTGAGEDSATTYASIARMGANFEVSIAPDVDFALMAAIALCAAECWPVSWRQPRAAHPETGQIAAPKRPPTPAPPAPPAPPVGRSED